MVLVGSLALLVAPLVHDAGSSSSSSGERVVALTHGPPSHSLVRFTKAYIRYLITLWNFI